MRHIFLLLAALSYCTAAKSQNRIMNIINLDNHLAPHEYNSAMTYYLDKSLPGASLADILHNSKSDMQEFIAAIPDDKIQYRYAPLKWTVGEVIQHIISYERIMLERAQVIAGCPPPVLRHAYYTQAGTAKGGASKSKSELLAEFVEVRNQTIEIYNNFSTAELSKVGTLDSNTASVKAIGICISGHQGHHFEVIWDRYL